MTPELPLPDLILPDTVVTVSGLDGTPFEAQLTPETPRRFAKLSWLRRFGLALFPVALIGLLWGGASAYFDEIRRELNPEVAARDHAPANGAALFAANCANCHGPAGRGDGPAALTTKARYYGSEPFKFTNTTGTRIPTDAQLVEVLKRGIEGSSMPSFANLRDDELDAIVRHIRVLTRRGKYDALWLKALKDYDEGGDDPNPAKVAHKADEACVVGDLLPPPKQLGPATAQSVAAGRVVYERVCQSCHGPTGAGDGPQVAQLRNENGTPARPRNLTGGVFKGGGEKRNIYNRVTLGIPGTPMPATPTLKPQEMSDLINYVLSLSPKADEVAGR